MRHLRQSLLISMLLATSVSAIPPLSGDFNGDGNLDCQDIHLLVAEIAAGTNNPLFDLNGDAIVNLDDLDAWLIEAGVTNTPCQESFVMGDVNLDGFVNVLDVVIVDGNMGQFGVGWCGGDVNADGVVSQPDRNIVMQNQGASSCGPLPVEPSNWGDVKARFGQ